MSAYRHNICMNFNDLLLQKHITQKKLSENSGVPRTTIVDLCTNKTYIKKCSSETLYKLSKTLRVTMEYLYEVDNGYDIDQKTYKPTDSSYLEKGLPKDIVLLLRKIKASLIKKDYLKYDYLYMSLQQELFDLERKEVITYNQMEYLLYKYKENSWKTLTN